MSAERAGGRSYRQRKIHLQTHHLAENQKPVRSSSVYPVFFFETLNNNPIVYTLHFVRCPQRWSFYHPPPPAPRGNLYVVFWYMVFILSLNLVPLFTSTLWVLWSDSTYVRYVTQYSEALGVTFLEVHSSKPAGYTVESLMQKLLKKYRWRFIFAEIFCVWGEPL
jgi:hypothetical protein